MVTNERGVTLVEVLASVVIVVLLAMVFMNLFLTSARSNEVSEEVVDHTFVAQRQMEDLYEAGQQYRFDEIETALTTDPYDLLLEQSLPDEKIFSKTEGGSRVEVTLSPYISDDETFTDLTEVLTKAVVEVSSPSEQGDPFTKIEGLIEWRKSADGE
ncbi:type IV pilus modification PilV family protein [Jeotgalibacillus haloalkalitolerans]|uniref:Type II secretion system protein n=1 Tax=Jeotgalibacillus haloalkalitolerans TaxID=3104292 RepID=A0ABU5KJ00_9BACL|nr:type II secretion system protein [Jeotgalibacillus sp. HH7-29]MDZ5710731.1 type II secretion system protein [Jeotgalibacillus sp. HH7-29]